MPLLVGTGPTSANIIQLASQDLTTTNLATGQVALSSLSTLVIVAANANRRYLGIMNNTGSTIYIGSTVTVSTLTGLELPTGSALNISRLTEAYTGAIFGRTIGGALTVSYIEI